MSLTLQDVEQAATLLGNAVTPAIIKAANDEKTLQREIGQALKREPALGPVLGLDGKRELQVFGQGRHLDFLFDGNVPVELKLLHDWSDSASLLSLLQQGLIWRAARGGAVMVVAAKKRREAAGWDAPSAALLGWLRSQNIVTVIADPAGTNLCAEEVSSAPRTPGEVGTRLADEVVAALTKHSVELTKNRGEAQKALKRSCVETAAAALGGAICAHSSPPSAVGANGAGFFVSVGGKTIEVHVPVIRHNDAGYADGKLQLGLARAFGTGE